MHVAVPISLLFCRDVLKSGRSFSFLPSRVLKTPGKAPGTQRTRQERTSVFQTRMQGRVTSERRLLCEVGYVVHPVRKSEVARFPPAATRVGQEECIPSCLRMAADEFFLV